MVCVEITRTTNRMELQSVEHFPFWKELEEENHERN